MTARSEEARLRKIETIVRKLVYSARHDFSAAGPADSGIFVSKAQARNLLSLLNAREPEKGKS
jgi:hypothetical protein